MKFKIKKYAIIGAAMAGSAVLFSCNGSDGHDGATGAPYVQLTNADLIENIFTASELRMTLDPSTTGSYSGTPEVYIDFDSRFLGNLENNSSAANPGLLTDQLVGNPQLLITGLVAPGNGTFTIGSIKGDVDGNGSIDGLDAPLFEQMTFTSVQIIQNTYIGTFQTLVGTTAEPVTLSQNAAAESASSNITSPAGFGPAQNVQQQAPGSAAVQVQDTKVPRTTLYTLKPTEVAVRFAGSGVDDQVYVLTAPAGLNFTGIVFDPNNIAKASTFVATTTPQRIVADSGSEFATGSFRLDIDTTAGGDAGFLPTNQPTGSGSF